MVRSDIPGALLCEFTPLPGETTDIDVGLLLLLPLLIIPLATIIKVCCRRRGRTKELPSKLRCHETNNHVRYMLTHTALSPRQGFEADVSRISLADDVTDARHANLHTTIVTGWANSSRWGAKDFPKKQEEEEIEIREVDTYYFTKKQFEDGTTIITGPDEKMNSMLQYYLPGGESMSFINNSSHVSSTETRIPRNGDAVVPRSKVNSTIEITGNNIETPESKSIPSVGSEAESKSIPSVGSEADIDLNTPEKKHHEPLSKPEPINSIESQMEHQSSRTHDHVTSTFDVTGNNVQEQKADSLPPIGKQPSTDLTETDTVQPAIVPRQTDSVVSSQTETNITQRVDDHPVGEKLSGAEKRNSADNQEGDNLATEVETAKSETVSNAVTDYHIYVNETLTVHTTEDNRTQSGVNKYAVDLEHQPNDEEKSFTNDFMSNSNDICIDSRMYLDKNAPETICDIHVSKSSKSIKPLHNTPDQITTTTHQHMHSTKQDLDIDQSRNVYSQEENLVKSHKDHQTQTSNDISCMEGINQSKEEYASIGINTFTTSNIMRKDMAMNNDHVVGFSSLDGSQVYKDSSTQSMETMALHQFYNDASINNLNLSGQSKADYNNQTKTEPTSIDQQTQTNANHILPGNYMQTYDNRTYIDRERYKTSTPKRNSAELRNVGAYIDSPHSRWDIEADQEFRYPGIFVDSQDVSYNMHSLRDTQTQTMRGDNTHARSNSSSMTIHQHVPIYNDSENAYQQSPHSRDSILFGDTWAGRSRSSTFSTSNVESGYHRSPIHRTYPDNNGWCVEYHMHGSKNKNSPQKPHASYISLRDRHTQTTDDGGLVGPYHGSFSDYSFNNQRYANPEAMAFNSQSRYSPNVTSSVVKQRPVENYLSSHNKITYSSHNNQTLKNIQTQANDIEILSDVYEMYGNNASKYKQRHTTENRILLNKYPSVNATVTGHPIDANEAFVPQDENNHWREPSTDRQEFIIEAEPANSLVRPVVQISEVIILSMSSKNKSGGDSIPISTTIIQKQQILFKQNPSHQSTELGGCTAESDHSNENTAEKSLLKHQIYHEPQAKTDDTIGSNVNQATAVNQFVQEHKVSTITIETNGNILQHSIHKTPVATAKTEDNTPGLDTDDKFPTPDNEKCNEKIETDNTPVVGEQALINDEIANVGVYKKVTGKSYMPLGQSNETNLQVMDMSGILTTKLTQHEIEISLLQNVEQSESMNNNKWNGIRRDDVFGRNSVRVDDDRQMIDTTRQNILEFKSIDIDHHTDTNSGQQEIEMYLQEDDIIGINHTRDEEGMMMESTETHTKESYECITNITSSEMHASLEPQGNTISSSVERLHNTQATEDECTELNSFETRTKFNIEHTSECHVTNSYILRTASVKEQSFDYRSVPLPLSDGDTDNESDIVHKV